MGGKSDMESVDIGRNPARVSLT